MKTRVKSLLTTLLAIVVVSGCSQFSGGIRSEFDDSYVSDARPTTGGTWTERSFLQEDDGYSGRAPASAGAVNEGTGEQGWTQKGRADGPVAQPSLRPQYKNGRRATSADFIDESTNEGSLWAPEGQTNFYFSKNKIRSIGDIITVTVEEQLVKDIELEVKRTLSRQEQQTELRIAQTKLIAAEMNKQAMPQESAAKAGAGVVVAEDKPVAKNMVAENKSKNNKNEPLASMKDVDLKGALEVKASDTVMAEIVERYPNGNYKIRGTKKIIYKNGSPRLVEMIAIARAQDITEEDIVTSGKLYEYRLEALY